MTVSNIRRYPSVSDSILISFFSELFEAELLTGLTLTFSGQSKKEVQGVNDLKSVAEDLGLGSSKLIQSASITHRSGVPQQNMHVEFHRGVTSYVGDRNGTAAVLAPSQFEMELEVKRPGQFAEKALEIYRRAEAHLLAGQSPSGSAVPDEMLSAITAQVAALGSAADKLYDDARNVRLDTEKELAELRSKQIEEINKTRANAEKERVAKLEKIREREEQLEQRLKEVDDRASMHARRAKAEQISQRLKARLDEPSVRPDVLRTRNMISRFSIAAMTVSGLIILSGVATFLPGFQTSSDLNAMLFASARIIGGSAAFFIVLIYLLSFLKRVSEEDANANQQLERYSLDMERSSWAIETVFELQGRGNAEIPQQWLDGVTNNLFGGAKTDDEEKTALEALGEILQTGAEFELGPNGGALRLNNKASKRIGKTGT